MPKDGQQDKSLMATKERPKDNNRSWSRRMIGGGAKNRNSLSRQEEDEAATEARLRSKFGLVANRR